MKPPFARRFFTIVILTLVTILLLGWWRMGSVVIEDEGRGYKTFTKAADEPVALTVLSYNVHARPVLDDPLHEFRFISPLLKRFDIVAAQECFTHHEELWADADHPVKIFQGTLAAPWKLTGSGLSTLSRFPVEEVSSMHFSHGGNWENRIASKGIVLSRMRIHGVAIDVYNTHMVAAKKEPSMIARRIQGRELIDFVRAHTAPDAPLIFLGDFNMRHSRGDDIHPEIAAGRVPESFDDLTQTQILAAILLALNLRDVGEELHGKEFDGVDHILYRSGKGVELKARACARGDEAFVDREGVELSDHAPLIVEFQLRTTSAE